MTYFRQSLIALVGAAWLVSPVLGANNSPVIQESTPAPTATSTTEVPAAANTPDGPASIPVENAAATPSATPAPASAPAAPKPAPAAQPARPAPPEPFETVTPTKPIPSGPKLVNLAPPATRFGDGITYIGHRYFEEKGGGWGWIKKEGDSWSSAKWVALKENPLRGILMPSRKMGSRSADQDYEYKMTGLFSDKQAYDPHLDEALPIFVIESYQSLGPAKPLERKPGPPERFTRSKRSRASSRDDRPVINHPDSDSF